MRYDCVSTWKAEQLENGEVVVTRRKMDGEESTFRTTSKLMKELTEIVNRHKMYRYRGSYVTKLRVQDGDSWSFDLKYANGSTTEASGYMKYPMGSRDAFDEVCEFLDEWCAVPDTSKMTYFTYRISNGWRRENGCNYSVSTGKDGLVHITIDEDKPHEKKIVTDYTGIFDDLQEIVLTYRIYTFKGDYMPDVEITDGDSWSLSVGYVDGPGIRAGGYMAWPEGFGTALNAVHRYFDMWRLMDTKFGKVSAEDAEAFIAGFDKKIDSELTSFRYERYEYGTGKAYAAYKAGNAVSFKYRGWDEQEEYSFTNADPKVLQDLKNVVNAERLTGLPQTPVAQQNEKRSRWLLEAVFEDGSKVEIVDYIPEFSFDYDRRVERLVDEIFENEYRALKEKSTK